VQKMFAEGRRGKENDRQATWLEEQGNDGDGYSEEKAGSSSTSVDGLLSPPVRPGSSPFGCGFCCTVMIHPNSCAMRAANMQNLSSFSVCVAKE